MYRAMTSSVTFSLVASRKSRIELLPLIAFMIRLGESVGGTLRNRCTLVRPHVPFQDHDVIASLSDQVAQAFLAHVERKR